MTDPAETPGPSRPLLAASAIALAVVLAVNVPAFLRTALDCDPILFDLYARDMARGGVLYRDMVENNTPVMIGLQACVRSTLGDSTEALRAVDLLVVGLGIGLLAWWSHPGRPDLRTFTFLLLAVLYLTTNEWCHVQRDVWLLPAVMAGMYLRRAQLGRLVGGRRVIGHALLEGAVWGLAVWLKPHAVVVAAPVWLAGAAWARSRGASGRAILADAAGLFAGGLAIGAAGVGVMDALGIWRPYVDHLTGWGPEYATSDKYGKQGSWFFRLGYLVRNTPWSLCYVLTVPAAFVIACRPLWSARPGITAPSTGDRPDRVLLAAALAGWAFQAWCLQHVFDYPHAAGEMLAVALLVDLAAGLRASGLHRVTLAAVATMTLIGHAKLFAERLDVWGECVRDEPTPELQDKLARCRRINWAELHRVADFLREQGAGPGEVNVISDTALPLWEILGQTPPTRYYIVHNNVVSFHSHRAQIVGALSRVPNQRFLVCDLSAIRWDPPRGYDWKNPSEWPLRDDWYGPRRWADRVVFRSGKYLVLAMPSADVPAWLDDVTEI